MAEPELKLEPRSESIILHFDVREGHEISTSTLAKSIKATEKIAKEVARIVVPNNQIYVRVRAPKQGSIWFEIVVGSVVGAPLALISSQFVMTMLKIWLKSETPIENQTKKLAGLISSVTSSILNLPIQRIDEIANQDDQIKQSPAMDKVIKDKSEVFKACDQDSNVKGINFRRNSDDFIPKSQFGKHRLKKKRKRNHPTLHLNVEAQIISATTVKDTKREWGLRTFKAIIDSTGEKILIINATMDDKDFLNDFLAGKHPLREHETPDVIHVRIEIDRILEDGEIKETKKSITKVYSFNGEFLAKVEPLPPDDDSLSPEINQDADLFD